MTSFTAVLEMRNERGFEILTGHRLLQHRVGNGGCELSEPWCECATTHEYDPIGQLRLISLDLIVEGLPVDLRHHQVADDRIEVWILFDSGESLCAPQHRDRVVSATKAPSQGGQHHGVVVDDQEPQPPERILRNRPTVSGVFHHGQSRVDGEDELEARAPIREIGDLKPPAMLLGDALRDGETEADDWLLRFRVTP